MGNDDEITNELDLEERYSMKQVSEMLELPYHTIRYWEQSLGMNIKRNEIGQRLFSKNDIDILTIAKTFMEQGTGLETIRKILISKNKLDPNVSLEAKKYPVDIDDMDLRERQTMFRAIMGESLKEPMNQLLKELTANQEEAMLRLSEQLKADMEKAIEGQRQAIIDVVKGIDGSVAKQVEDALDKPQQALERVEQRIKERDDEIINLIQQKMSEKTEKMPFWKRWFGAGESNGE